MAEIPFSSALYRLHGRVQHYPWGGYEFIPRLLGLANPELRPFAELWMGTHPQAPSEVESGGERLGLDALVRREPERILGAGVHARFGAELPFLFKILDARDMLSIQVHPSRPEAEAGFAAEEAAGVPRNAPQRNYRDRNHKPEVHVALTRFWMLHGFRPLAEIADLLDTIPAFTGLAPWFSLYLHDVQEDPAGQVQLLRRLYEQLMTLPQQEVDRVLGALLDQIGPLFDRGLLKKISPHFWAVKAARAFPLAAGGFDRGIFSIYLLNLLKLEPGQGTFQGAGVPHAYLEGTTVELMANSDNVLRGGLTPKHVDVPELLKTIRFNGGKPELLTATPLAPCEKLYSTAVEDFQLARIDLQAGAVHRSPVPHGPDILILLEGSAAIAAAGEQLELGRGAIVLAAADVEWQLRSTSGALLFRASVPASQGSR
ncbi:MAG TPA: mannose-6-phosphate isomerase, class I [bacterium]|nr:mannose-6-phosphate isomerase, class I [bacterium]HPR88269.1 mannose-6-phosphate isomerase, class I [bacterium]